MKCAAKTYAQAIDRGRYILMLPSFYIPQRIAYTFERTSDSALYHVWRIPLRMPHKYLHRYDIPL